MSRVFFPSIQAGLLSAGLYYLALPGVIGGTLIWLVALLPLFYSGFLHGSVRQRHTTILCFLLLLPSTLFSHGLFSVALLMLIPSALMGTKLLATGSGRMIVTVFTTLNLYFCLLLTGMALLLASGGNSLENVLVKMIGEEGFGDSTIELSIVDTLHQAPYLFCATAICVWSLFLYGTACLANFICRSYRSSLRPSLQIESATPSRLLLSALILSGLASMVSGGALALCAKTTFLCMLFSYLLFGLGLIHRKTLHLNNRPLILTVFYIFLIGSPVLSGIVAGFGIYRHLSELMNPKM